MLWRIKQARLDVSEQEIVEKGGTKRIQQFRSILDLVFDWRASNCAKVKKACKLNELLKFNVIFFCFFIVNLAYLLVQIKLTQVFNIFFFWVLTCDILIW